VAVTKKASYGLIAAVEIARSPANAPVSAAAIADRYSLPLPFVEKILRQLRLRGVVRSKQGRYGGYSLCANAEDVSVRHVLEALDENLDLVSCLGSQVTCDLDAVCPTKRTWGRINQRFLDLLGSLSLKDLADGSEQE